MTSISLSVAKASFAAGLLRPDPTPVSRDELSRFHTLLNTVLLECSPTNVQQCRKWLVSNCVPSSSKTTSLVKYLAAVSASLDDGGSKAAPSSARRRLHILYLLSDALHHLRYHEATSANYKSFSNGIQPHLLELVAHTSASSKGHAKLERRLDDLLAVWERQKLLESGEISRLRERATAAKTSDFPIPTSQTRAAAVKGWGDNQDVPYNLPATHGDPSTPYYDLPAANMMPHIRPNSPRPINISHMKPIQLTRGPADSGLVNTVKDFMEDIDRIFRSPYADEQVQDVDAMGQPLVKDPDTGELVPLDTYYGWSASFCEQMKRRARELASGSARGRERSRSSSRPRQRSYTPSRGSSRTPKRRDQRSHSRSRSRNHSRDRTRNGRSRSKSSSRAARRRRYSSSRSRSPYPHKSRRSRSRSQLRPQVHASNEPREWRDRPRNQGPPPLQYSPPISQPAPGPPFPASFQGQPPFSSGPFPPPNLQFANMPFPMPMGPNSMQMQIPPPPAGYTGNWPPHPPPPIAPGGFSIPPPPPMGMPYAGPMPSWPGTQQQPPQVPSWQGGPQGPQGWGGMGGRGGGRGRGRGW